MSATENPDLIDLNSDFVSVDGEKGSHRGDASTVCDSVFETETVLNHSNGLMKAVSPDRLDGGMNCRDGVSNLELEMGSDEEMRHAEPFPAMDGGNSDRVVAGEEMGRVDALEGMVEAKTQDVTSMGVDDDVPEAGVADPHASSSDSASEIMENQHVKEDVEAKTEDNQMADDAPVVGVSKIPGNEFNLFVDLNSCMDREENSKSADGVDDPIERVCEITGNKFNACNLFVDLNSCMDREGISKSGDEICSERTEVADISLGENASYHGDNEDVASGRPDKTKGGWSKQNGKKYRELTSRRPCVSDLVWGKVRSHPWWPGMIFDPSAATEMAKKYYKKDSFLIAYFGDQTFAWNEASRIKPFGVHFSQMEKQSDSEDFTFAVDCALDEVSRRVKFGLVCSCLPEDLVASIRSQIIVNAGIWEESSRIDGGDGFLGVDSFEPAKLIQYIKMLAVFLDSGVDRLEDVISQAQILAFYRSKRPSHIPNFKMLGMLLEEDEVFLLSDNAEQPDELRVDRASDIKDEKKVPSGEENLKTPDGSNHKRKKISGVDTNSIKKEKSMLEVMASTKLISSSSRKKQKAVDSTPDDLEVKLRKIDLSASKQTFRVGESILKVACKLNGDCHDESVLNNGNKVKSAWDNSVLSAWSLNSQESPNAKFIPTEYCAPDEMISRLCVAAKDPTKGYSFMTSVISFFSDFRSSVCMDPAHFGKVAEDGEGCELEYMEDADSTENMVQNIPLESSIPVADPQASLVSTSNVDTEQQSAGGTRESKAVYEKCKEEQSLTALILNFSDLDSVPSVANLNKIYSQFGPLKESRTEVLKKSSRAKVVFKRRSDAETAFSSAGKYKIFGPSLVSYSLKYLPSTPSKASPHPKKKRKKDATSE